MDGAEVARSGGVGRGPKSFGVLDTLRFLRDPQASLARIRREYGDTFHVPDPKQPTLMTGDPAAVKAIFTADPDTFDVPLKAQLAPFVGASSLLLTSGPRHKKDRKLLAPPFHGARMRAYGDVVVGAANAAAAAWKPARAFTLLESTQAITLEVILRAVFGVEAGERREAFRVAVLDLMAATASPLITMFEGLRRSFGGIGPWARFTRAKARFDALVVDELTARRAEGVEGREDILSLMMSARYDDGSAMTDEELRDQLHVLLFAGHETTATALAWAFYRLCRHPEVHARLMAAIGELGPAPRPDAIASIPYLDAVCHETLRIHPIVLNVGRLLAKPLVILDTPIDAGTTVMVSVLMLHDREDVYPDPRAFRPERFIERSFGPHEWIPFGGGARRCIGAALALYEMKIVLATLLASHPLKLADDAEIPPIVRGLTLQPKGGVKVRLA